MFIDWLKEMRDSSNGYMERIQNKTLSKDNVKAFVVHYPSSKDCGWDEETTNYSIKCLKELYQYSLEMGYIDSSMTFEEFVK